MNGGKVNLLLSWNITDAFMSAFYKVEDEDQNDNLNLILNSET